ncbi:MAG: ExeM/NucH family extracellular endonuclease [Ardenticatenaceae bacterium]|nr:ExeM/NucH family extracellular endonuclease [Ardenticatenaceae bacterium]
MQRRYLSLGLLGLLAIFLLVLSGGGTAVAAPLDITIFINEIHYDNASTDTGEAVEVAGPTGTDLSGWSIVFYNGNGGASYGTANLSGTIPDLQNGCGVVSIAYSGIQNGAPDGLALVDSGNNVIQFLSYEGSFTAIGGPADGMTSVDIGVTESGSTPVGDSLQLSGTGAIYEDFTWATSSAETFDAVNTGQTFNCSGGGDTAPSVSSTNPTDGATAVPVDADLSITFSEAVNVAGDWFQIACASSGTRMVADTAVSGGPTAFTINPNADFAEGETCTVTVYAAQVTDQDSDDPPDNMAADYIWNFTTFTASACAAADTPIHTIQGSGAASPEDNNIHTIQGIVVGDFQASDINGFFVQEEDAEADADPQTSEGIFVYEGSNSVDVAMGDEVQVTGTIDEYYTLTELTTVTDVHVCSSGNAMPTAGSITLPLAATNALEQYEGMRVTTAQTWTVTNSYFLGRGGALTLSYNDRLMQPTQVTTPGMAANAWQASNNLNQIILDEGSLIQNPDPIVYPAPGGLSASNTVRGGDQVSDLIGVLTYSYYGWSGSLDAYRIHPTQAPTFSSSNSRPATPPAVGGTLKVATFNVLNYFNTFTGCTAGVSGAAIDCRGAEDATEFTRQRDKIINAIVTLDADVVGLMEIENDGYGGSSAIADLVDGLNAVAGAGTYAYVDADALMGTINILGTDAIKVGLLYKPGTVSLVGDTAVLNSTIDITFLDTKNRPTLIQSFQETASGEIFTVAVNHLKSKGSACDDVSDPDTGDGQGNCNLTREAAAQAMVNYLVTDPTNVSDPDFLIIGDLNSYAMEDPIVAIEAASYTNLAKLYGDTYGYSFDGQWGTLDYALSSSSLTSQVSNARGWHINADEPIVLDYNTNFKSAGQIASLYNADAYRASDHDPIIVGLNLTLPHDVIINEVDYDQVGTDTAEFIELKNISTGTVSLNGYTVELVNGSDGSVYETITLPDVTLAAGAYYLLCASSPQVTNCDWTGAFASIQNGAPDAIGLRYQGSLVDALSYEGSVAGYTETSATVAADSNSVMGISISRFPDGIDTDDNSADFSARCITPGTANSSQTGSCTVDFMEECTVSTGTPISVGTTNPIALEFTDLGSPAISCVRVMYFGYDHPNASSALQTGAYWHIEAIPSDAGTTTAFTYDLTLPFTNPVYPDDKVCRWLEGAGSGYGWDCEAGAIGDYTATNLTRSGLHGFSDWAVGDYVGPTAVTLQTLSTQPTAAWLPLLALIAGLFFIVIAKRKRN